MYVCMYVCMYVYMYVCMYVCMYVRVYVCMYVCIRIHVYLYRYILSFFVTSIIPFFWLWFSYIRFFFHAFRQITWNIRSRLECKTSEHVYINKDMCINVWSNLRTRVINMRRLRFVGSLKIQFSFAEHRSLLWGSFAKETYIFKKPINRSHPIVALYKWYMIDITLLYIYMSYYVYHIMYIM